MDLFTCVYNLCGILGVIRRNNYWVNVLCDVPVHLGPESQMTNEFPKLSNVLGMSWEMCLEILKAIQKMVLVTYASVEETTTSKLKTNSAVLASGALGI